MRMKRIHYLGKEDAVDARLGGVELKYGTKVDVPEDLAEILLGEPQYSDLPGPPVSLEEVRTPGIMWYEAAPGEELRALTGISDSRAKWLANYGIDTLEDMANLTETEQAALAEEMPRVSLEQVEAWVNQAKQL